MTEQPEALRLAITPGAFVPVDVETTSALCAELRRLHEEVQEQCRINGMGAERELRLMAEKQELLEALNIIAAWHDGEVGGHMDEPYAAEVARAAIAKAEGETK